jgi:hypothetical protein
MSVVRVCQITDVVCSRNCYAGPCKLEKAMQIETHGTAEAQPAPSQEAHPADGMPQKEWLDEALDWDMRGTPITRRTCIEMQCGSLALAYVEDAIRAHLSLRLAQPEQPAAKRVRCGWDFANDRPIMRDELPGESQSAQPAVDAEWLEEIAQQWDGCIYDAGPGGNIDIGQSIREAWERRSALTHLRARPAAQALSDEQIAVRGRFDVAVALLRECLGPLEVSAAIIESDDGEPMEALIRRAKTFVSAASAPKEPTEPTDGQMPTPELFRKALRMAQREHLNRHPPRYVNDDQADASMSDDATELTDCYRTAMSHGGTR